MFGIYNRASSIDRSLIFKAPSPQETYKRVLKELSWKRINRIVANDTFDDSAAVYERFFYDCENHIRIVARGLKPSILNRTEVISAAEHFMAKEHSTITLDLRAVDEDEEGAIYDSPFFQALIGYAPSSEKKVSLNLYRPTNKDDFLKGLPLSLIHI